MHGIVIGVHEIVQGTWVAGIHLVDGFGLGGRAHVVGRVARGTREPQPRQGIQRAGVQVFWKPPWPVRRVPGSRLPHRASTFAPSPYSASTDARYPRSRSVAAFDIRTSRVGPRRCRTARAASRSCSPQIGMLWLSGLAQYAITKPRVFRLCRTEGLRAASNSKLCRSNSPRMKSGCAAAAPEFGKFVSPRLPATGTAAAGGVFSWARTGAAQQSANSSAAARAAGPVICSISPIRAVGDPYRTFVGRLQPPAIHAEN